MKRVGSVVAKNNHTIVLKLIQTEKCVGCPAHCNKPLIDWFGLRKNLFVLSMNNPSYQLSDPNNLFKDRKLSLEQLINLRIDEKDLLVSSVWLYFLPLLVCLSGIVIGHYCGQLMSVQTDMTALLGLFVALVLCGLFLRRKITSKHLKFRPKVTIL